MEVYTIVIHLAQTVVRSNCKSTSKVFEKAALYVCVYVCIQILIRCKIKFNIFTVHVKFYISDKNGRPSWYSM